MTVAAAPGRIEPEVVAEPTEQRLEGVSVAVHRARKDGHLAPVLALVFGKRLGQIRRLPRGEDPPALHDESVA